MRHDEDFSQRHEAIMIHSAASRTDCLKRHMASVARIKYDQVMGYPLEFLKKWSSPRIPQEMEFNHFRIEIYYV